MVLVAVVTHNTGSSYLRRVHKRGDKILIDHTTCCTDGRAPTVPDKGRIVARLFAHTTLRPAVSFLLLLLVQAHNSHTNEYIALRK